jgi:hypothetical protein
MNKLAIIKIEQGDWENGFPVSLHIGEDGSFLNVPASGDLPGKLELLGEYKKWRSLYYSLPNSLRLDKPAEQVTNSSDAIANCRKSADDLKACFNSWLDSQEFNTIFKKLQRELNTEDNIRVVIQTDDLELRRLPWHSWDLFDSYKSAEIALSASCFDNVNKANKSQAKKQLKILAIFGNSEGINLNKDEEFLRNLPKAQVEFLVEPERKKITTNLWEQNWDLLFFAGHSSSQDEKGVIYYNKTEKLSLDELKNGLKKAIEGGLKLAIFNSCDGLKLAQDLEDLHIPQTIVMREPVPDVIAQDFLKSFLLEFSAGKSLYMAVRNARERLHDDWENQIPGASWLPIICQNLAAKPLLWQPPKRDFLKPLLLVVVAAVLASVVWLFYSSVTAYKTYEEERHQISLKYPANWEVKTEPITKDVIFISPKESPRDNFQEFLSVTVEPVRSGISLEEYIENEFYPISQKNQYLINYVDYQIGGQEGRKIFYQSSSTRVLIKEQYLTIKNNNAYIITYILEEGKESPELAKEVEKMVDSLVIGN